MPFNSPMTNWEDGGERDINKPVKLPYDVTTPTDAMLKAGDFPKGERPERSPKFDTKTFTQINQMRPAKKKRR